MNREPRCRVCGCTDYDACPTPAEGCHWVEPDLCSACADQPSRLQLTPELMLALERDRLHFTLSGDQAMLLYLLLPYGLDREDLPEELLEFASAFGQNLYERLRQSPSMPKIVPA